MNRPTDLAVGLYALVGFSSVSVLTWFFSSRPRLFLRVFVPAEELRGAARWALRDPKFARGMRWMAALQLAAGLIVIFAVLVFSEQTE